jgi:protein phosphatase 4 regulatory subunit 3
VASLTLLSQADTELSLQQHLDLAPELLHYNRLVAEVDQEEPLTMAAQPVPHQSTDKKRVKVYELRNNDWFDRGTGFCTASFHTVSYVSGLCATGGVHTSWHEQAHSHTDGFLLTQ